jgi:hypothetical protein
MTTTLNNRDPKNVAVTHNSGSMRPVPTNTHDARTGGQIPPSQYQTPVPIKNGGQE